MGFQEIMPLRSLWVLSVSEVSSLLHGDSEQWTPAILRASVRCDHGYNAGSPEIIMLFEIISAFNNKERRMLMQFITGAPCLPIGGLKALSPPLTVVRKDPEAWSGLTADSYMPSVMTCVNYLKLPPYSSIKVMRAQLLAAIEQGQSRFDLS